MLKSGTVLLVSPEWSTKVKKKFWRQTEQWFDDALKNLSQDKSVVYSVLNCHTPERYNDDELYIKSEQCTVPLSKQL